MYMIHFTVVVIQWSNSEENGVGQQRCQPHQRSHQGVTPGWPLSQWGQKFYLHSCIQTKVKTNMLLILSSLFWQKTSDGLRTTQDISYSHVIYSRFDLFHLLFSSRLISTEVVTAWWFIFCVSVVDPWEWIFPFFFSTFEPAPMWRIFLIFSIVFSIFGKTQFLSLGWH